MSFPSSDENSIIGLQVLSENQTICAAFSNGDIYTIQINSQMENVEVFKTKRKAKYFKNSILIFIIIIIE